MAWFDATTWPRLVVKAGFGALPGGNMIILGTGPGLGTGTLGGISMVEIGADVRSITVTDLGQSSDVDVADPAICTVVVNNASGDYSPTNLSGPYVSGGVSLVKIAAPLEMYAEKPAGMLWPLFTGRVADIALDAGIDPTVTFTCADGLEDLGRAQLALETPQFEGQYTGQRIGTVADRAGWPTIKRALDRGTDTLGLTRFGASALELMRKTALSEFGILFVDPSGNLIFYDRYRVMTANRSVNIQAVFTDTAAAGELDISELQLSKSRERVFNSANITRDQHLDPVTGEPDETDQPVEQTAADQASIDELGILSFGAEAGTLLTSDPACLAMAQGLVARFKDPVERFREIRVNALSQRILTANLWPTLLGLRLLDRITVRRDYGPETIGPTALLIQSISIEINSDPPTWEIRLGTTAPPASVDPFILDAGQLGVDQLIW